MNKQEIIDKVNQNTWLKSLERHFPIFVTSLFMADTRKDSCRAIKQEPLHIYTIAYQDNCWYFSEEMMNHNLPLAEQWHKRHSMKEQSEELEKLRKEGLATIEKINKPGAVTQQLKAYYDIMTKATTFIYTTHVFEKYFTDKINSEVPKYIKENQEEFIAAASTPIKKNAHYYFEQAMRNKEDPQAIAEKYGWIKCRFEFIDGFSAEEIKEEMKNLKPTKPHHEIDIPEPLRQLFDEIKELVYFRTARTDVFYELLYRSRPFLKRVAKHFNIDFKDFPNYTIQSLMADKPESYKESYAAIAYDDDIIYSHENILKSKAESGATEVKGTIAQKGKAIGIVKIIKRVTELDKVKKGDILVTQMTFPSFITAMHRAAAFVTDEGGITCHAAIVAREMKKPCIIGTGNATSILKDGDKVEVDAEKGIVRKFHT